MSRYDNMLHALASGDLESAKARVLMTQRALTDRPDWLAKHVFPRLKGYPQADACWLWTGTKPDGYGMVGLPNGGPSVLVHRTVWIAVNGTIPDGLVLDHDGPTGCHNRACANPAHLQAVTVQHNTVVTGNSTAVQNMSKTHCPSGHELSPENLRPDASKVGARGCLICRTEWLANRWRLIMAASAHLGISTTEYRKRHGMSTHTARRLLTTARDMCLEVLPR